MSVIESGQVDGIAASDKKTLVLLITDHLDWENEHNHLMLLQDKINSYIAFIESGQYRDMEQFKRLKIKKYIIEISFQYKPTENCTKFINNVNEQLKKLHIFISPAVE